MCDTSSKAEVRNGDGPPLTIVYNCDLERA
jgi:hypothetical protein